MKLNKDELKAMGLESISDIRVMSSNAGYYIGRTCVDLDGFEDPYSRESGYFPTWRAASEALDTGFAARDCAENRHAGLIGD